MKSFIKMALVLFVLAGCVHLFADDVPPEINYQGYVTDDKGKPFNGTGQFKFTIVNSTGNTTYWSNNGTSISGSEPTNYITTTVTNGVFNIILGDTDITNMMALPKDIFSNGQRLYLGVWFNDGSKGFEKLSPDREITASAYAINCDAFDNTIMNSLTLDSDNATGSGKIALGTLTAPQTYTLPDLSGEVSLLGQRIESAEITDATIADSDLADNAVTNSKIANDAVNGSKILDGTVDAADLKDSAVVTAKIADNAVTTAKIVDSSVTGNKIPDGAITEAKLDILDSPADGERLSWNNTQSKFEWTAPSSNLWTDAGTYVYPNNYNQFVITDTGNVGIGNATPAAKLDIAGNIIQSANSYLNYGTTQGVSGYGIRDNAGSMQFKNSAGSWLNIPTTASSAGGWNDDGTVVRLTTGTDKVGIGTSTPNTPFSIVRDLGTTNTWNDIAEFRRDSNPNGIGYATGYRTTAGAVDYSYIFFGGQKDIAFLSYDTTYGGPNNRRPVLHCNYKGKIGIGTISPQANLHIVAETTGILGPSIRFSTWNVSQKYTDLYHDGAGNFNITNYRLEPTLGAIKFNPQNQELMRLVDKKVGIGTTTPAYALDVSRSSNGIESIRIYNPNNGISARAMLAAQSFDSTLRLIAYPSTLNTASLADRCGVFAAEDSAGLVVGAANSTGTVKFLAGGWQSQFERMIIDASGNAGIGTNTPTARLDINGTTGYNQLRMRSSYTPTGSADANGNTGDIAWDSDYIYIKTSAGWKRSALSTW